MPSGKGKKSTAQTTKRNAAASKKTASNAKSSKRASPSESPEEVPIWDRYVTSNASRERKRVKITRASLYSNGESIETITAMAEKLQGESRYSFGLPQNEPLEASRTKKTRARRAKNNTEDAYMQMFNAMLPKPRLVIPNSPDRSPILRIPFEIRERILSYLLVYPKPILVKPDWITVERNPFKSHAIVKVCKQFADEASQFIYKFNTFQAVVRNPNKINRRNDEDVHIDSKFHSLFQNIVIDCNAHCWNLEWYEKVTAGLQKLVDARATIQTLTLVLAPDRVGMTETALGTQSNPVTFADFLWYDGSLMAAIRNLTPRRLNVVVKPKDDRNKKLLLSVDMTYFQAEIDETPLANSETVKLAQEKASDVSKELHGLKERFEEIFEDERRAVNEGMCRVLADGKIF